MMDSRKKVGGPQIRRAQRKIIFMQNHAPARYAIIGVVLLAFVLSAHGEQTVKTCTQLLDGLLDPSINHLVVQNQVLCNNQTDWPLEIQIGRNILVEADTFGESYMSLPDFTTALILETESFLTFDHMILVVATEDESTTLPFLDSHSGGKVFLDNTIIAVRLCNQNPEEHRTVVDERVSIVNDAGNEILRACNTVHTCIVNGTVKESAIKTIEGGSNTTDCSNAEGMHVRAQGVNALSSDSESKSSASIVIIIAAICGILILLLIGLVIFSIRRRARLLRDKMLTTEMTDIQLYHPPDDHRRLESGERGVERNETDPRGIVNDPLALSNWNFRLSDIEIVEPLGRGSFGKVYKGHWQGTDVAVKAIVHGKSFLEARNEPFEAYLSRQVSHPNVIQTFIVHTVPAGETAPLRIDAMGHQSTVSDVGQQSIHESIMSTDDVFGSMTKAQGEHEGDTLETWIVLEYCDRGSLAKAIQTGTFLTFRNGIRRPNLVYAILTALDIAHAMMYLHNVRIIHGDLKAANVLLKSDMTDPRGFVCKVGDFGLSRFLADDTHIETFTCGTITHMPPELLKGGVLTPAADVYSFAILMWELLTGVNPYGTKTHGEIVLIVVNRQKRPAIPDYCSDGYAELLEDCWRQCHLERPGFPEIVDRLKDLLEEEMANATETEFRDDTSQLDPGVDSLEMPSLTSRPMSSEYGCVVGEELFSSQDSTFFR